MTTGTTAIYARVSTQKKDLDVQKQNCFEYVTEDLEVDPANIEVYEDKATGDNLARNGYDNLMRDAEIGAIDRVLVKEVSRIAPNMRDLNKTVGHLCDDNDVAVHVLDSGLQINEADGCTTTGS